MGHAGAQPLRGTVIGLLPSFGMRRAGRMCAHSSAALATRLIWTGMPAHNGCLAGTGGIETALESGSNSSVTGLR